MRKTVTILMVAGLFGLAAGSAWSMVMYTSLSGKVIHVTADSDGGWFQGSILLKRSDGTYAVVFIPHTISPEAANRMLCVAVSARSVNIWFVTDQGSGEYQHYATSITEVQAVKAPIN